MNSVIFWKNQNYLIAGLAILGGLLVIIGSLLPWVNLFAGLQHLSGITGLNGRLTLLGGTLSVLLAAFLIKTQKNLLRFLIGVLGLILAIFSGWILYGLKGLYQHNASDPMLLASPGPGVIVVAAGAALLLIILVIDLFKRLSLRFLVIFLLFVSLGLSLGALKQNFNPVSKVLGISTSTPSQHK